MALERGSPASHRSEESGKRIVANKRETEAPDLTHAPPSAASPSSQPSGAQIILREPASPGGGVFAFSKAVLGPSSLPADPELGVMSVMSVMGSLPRCGATYEVACRRSSTPRNCGTGKLQSPEMCRHRERPPGANARLRPDLQPGASAGVRGGIAGFLPEPPDCLPCKEPGQLRLQDATEGKGLGWFPISLRWRRWERGEPRVARGTPRPDGCGGSPNPGLIQHGRRHRQISGFSHRCRGSHRSRDRNTEAHFPLFLK